MIIKKNLLKSFIGLLVMVVVLFFGFQDYTSASTSNFYKAINFQSKLTDDEGNIVPDGEYNVRFKLYDTSTGGVALWTELCDGDNRVQVVNGLFSHYLGSITPFDDFDFNQSLWLGVEIGGSGDSPDWDGEMTPRKKIGAVPAAFEADKLDGIDSEQFLRSDEPDTMNASSSNILLTVQQDGSGNIVNFKVGDSSKLLIDNNGRVGIGTDTPSDKLTIFDGSVFQGMPVNPTVVGGDNLYFSSAPKAIYVSGKYAYVGCYDNSGVNGFRIIDVSEPTNPAVIGGENLSLPDEVSSIHVSGRYAYMGFKSYGTDAFRIIDVSDPANPTVVGGENLNLPGNAKFIDVSGRYAYIGLDKDGANAFRIIDVSDPTNPVVVGGENLGFPDLEYPNWISITSFYVSGRYAYLGLCRADSTSSFGSLMIIDVFNPASPIIIGEELILPQTAQSIYVSGRYAYMGLGEYDAESGTDLFRIIDISDPTNPVVVGGENLNLPGRVKSIDVSGKYAYIGIGKSDTEPGANSFRIIDVSDPANPTVVGGENLSLPNWARSIHVSGRYAYMGFMGCCDDDPEGTSFNAFRIIDITGIEAVSVIANSLEAGNLQVRNDILAQGELQISGSANIGSGLQVTGPVSVFGGSTSTSFMPFVIDHNGYVGIGTNAPSDKLTIYDGSVFQGMPFNPTIVGGENLSLPESAASIYVSGKYAYVGFWESAGTNILRIIDVSDPTNPTVVGGESLSLPGWADAIYVSGRYAYVGFYNNSGVNSFRIIDISDPSNPIVVGGEGLDLPEDTSSVYVSGRYAYLGFYNDAGTDIFRIIDVSDPTSPTIVGGESLSLPKRAESVYISGKYAYLALSNDVAATSTFRIIDVSDPTSPTIVGGENLSLPELAYSVYVSGRYAYIAFCNGEEKGILRIIDVSDPTNPIVVGGESLSLPSWADEIYVSGRYAYISFSRWEEPEGFRIIDVSDPTSPTVVGGENLYLPDWPESLYVSGKYAYMVFNNYDPGTDAFRIIDITGIEAVSVVANSLEAGNLQVRNDILAQGELQISGSANIGSGLQVTGPVSIFGGSTSSKPFVIDQTGNVGIGITTPTSKLTIQGSGISTTTSALHIQNASGTSMMFVRDDGNIGIGTSSPETLFHIEGTTTAQNIVPRGDAIYNLGSAEQRWNNLYTATTSVGDLLFSNDFRIIEATNSPESLIILNQNGEKIAELDETGNFWAKRLTIEESTNGQIVDISSEQLKISLASLGLIISEDGNLETEKIRTKGIELIDKATGEIYCTWIENGEWQKEKGECGTLYESEEENNILGGGGGDMNEGGNESENTEENGEGIEGESVNEDESEGESESENGEGDNEEGEEGEGEEGEGEGGEGGEGEEEEEEEEEEEGAIDQAEENESGSESESEEESGSEGEEESGDEGGEEFGGESEGESEGGEELGEESEGEDGEVPEEEIGSESNGENDGESEESEITNQPEESEEDIL